MQSLLLLASDASDTMLLGLRLRLSAMMFLEFAIWGAWIVVLGNYLNSLGFSRKAIAWAYSTMPIGAIIAPMFVGTIADQYFATQNVMAVSHLLGGLLLLWMAQVRTPVLFFAVALAYALVYSPTLSLVNTVVFENVKTREFPELRVLGTIGWIVAGMSLKFLIKPDQPVNNRPILLAAALSFILGGLSFVLPNTPPEPVRAQGVFDTQAETLNRRLQAGEITQQQHDSEKAAAQEALRQSGSRIPFLEAVGMFRDPAKAVFFIGALVVAMAMAVYFAFAGLFLEQGAGVKPENVGPVMTIGQWVEIFFLVSLSWFIDHWGMDKVLIIGMTAWALRFAIFSARPPLGLVLLGVALHGICFDFFFAAGMMHTKTIAPAGIGASAQSLYGVLVYGLGMLLGTALAGWLNERYTTETTDRATGKKTAVTDWRKFWLIPCIGVVVALAVFVAYFRA